MLKIILLTFLLVAIAFAGLGIRLLLDRNAEFRGGSCQTRPGDPNDKELGCGCGGSCSSNQ